MGSTVNGSDQLKPVRRDRSLTAKRHTKEHPSQLLHAFDGLPLWRLATAGVEAQHRVRVGRTSWTVCYKVHVIAACRTEYKASITLWPNVRTRLKSRRIAGWNAGLKNGGWYERSARELRRHGYRGTWRWSPWGRMGDFWKRLQNLADLDAEAERLERLRETQSLIKSIGDRTTG